MNGMYIWWFWSLNEAHKLFEKEELLDVYKRGLCPNEFSLSVEKSLSALER